MTTPDKRYEMTFDSRAHLTDAPIGIAPDGRLIPAQQVPKLLRTNQLLHDIAGDLISDMIQKETGGTRAYRKPPPLTDGEIFWLSPDLVHLMLEAASGLDSVHWGTVDAPSRHGLVVFSQPVVTTTLETKASGGRLLDTESRATVRALEWHMSGEFVVIQSYVEGPDGALQNTGMSLGAYDQTYPLVGLQPAQLLVTILALLHNDGIVTEALEKTPSPPPVRKKGSGRVTKAPKTPAVRVVWLRPGSDASVAYDAAGGKNVQWRHRWLVRAHFRRQPYPSLGEGVYKQILIAPYIKGPEGAPLLGGQKVVAVGAKKRA